MTYYRTDILLINISIQVVECLMYYFCVLREFWGIWGIQSDWSVGWSYYYLCRNSSSQVAEAVEEDLVSNLCFSIIYLLSVLPTSVAADLT